MEGKILSENVTLLRLNFRTLAEMDNRKKSEFESNFIVEKRHLTSFVKIYEIGCCSMFLYAFFHSIYALRISNNLINRTNRHLFNEMPPSIISDFFVWTRKKKLLKSKNFENIRILKI